MLNPLDPLLLGLPRGEQDHYLSLVGPRGTPAPTDPSRHRRWEHGYAEVLSWMPDLSGVTDQWETAPPWQSPDGWWSTADELLRRAHHGICAICFTQPKRLYRDHDHQTGFVRGYLCPRCNSNAPSFVAPRSLTQRYPHKYRFHRYTQWPPAAAAKCRIPSSAPDRSDVLWHVGPDRLPARGSPPHEPLTPEERRRLFADPASAYLGL